MSEQLPDPLLGPVLGRLDDATRALSLLARDPAEAIDDASEALDIARATLRLTGQQGGDERPVLDEAAKLLRPLHALYVSKRRPYPPPLAPSIQQSVTRITIMILGARVRLGDCPAEAASSSAIEKELDRSYRRARRRWRRLTDNPSIAARHRAQRAVRRVSHQLDAIGLTDQRVSAFVQLGDLLGNDDGFAELASSVFAPTPKRHLRWARSTIVAMGR